MKILYHNPNRDGGLGEYAAHQGQAIAEIEGVELYWQSPQNVAIPDPARVLASLPAPVVRAGRGRWQRAWDFLSWVLGTNRALDRAIAQYRPDAVMLPGWSEYFAPLWAWRLRRWRRRGVRFGALIHDPVRDFQLGGKWLHRISLRYAYSFIDVAFVHEVVDLETAGAQKPKVVVVPLGPYKVAQGDAAPSGLRKKLSIPPDARVLLSFGHIRDGKCLDAVIEALVECANCHLLVAGREQSGGQKPVAFYQTLASKLGVADRCHWFNDYIPNDEVWHFFRASDRLLLLYSKDFHSMSAVLNVNVQFRLPVLASAGGGPLLKTVQTYGLGQTLVNPTPRTIAQALILDDVPVPRWDDYIRDHSWETNAQRVVEALQLDQKHPLVRSRT